MHPGFEDRRDGEPSGADPVGQVRWWAQLHHEVLAAVGGLTDLVDGHDRRVAGEPCHDVRLGPELLRSALPQPEQHLDSDTPSQRHLFVPVHLRETTGSEQGFVPQAGNVGRPAHGRVVNHGGFPLFVGPGPG